MKYVFLFILLFLILMPQTISAQELRNSEIKIQLNPSPKTQEQKDSLLKIYNKVSNGIENDQDTTIYDKYVVKIPYFKEYNRLPLGIALSQDSVSFGMVTSGEPIIRTQKLSVFSQNTNSYSVFTAENHNLTSSTNIQIPNTSCDSGSCSSVLSDKWDLPLTYGFGYTCENREICNSAFEGGLYRRFASLENKESYAVILEGSGNTKSNIIYKLNISPTQPQESYQNTIYYILAPNF